MIKSTLDLVTNKKCTSERAANCNCSLEMIIDDNCIGEKAVSYNYICEKDAGVNRVMGKVGQVHCDSEDINVHRRTLDCGLCLWLKDLGLWIIRLCS